MQDIGRKVLGRLADRLSEDPLIGSQLSGVQSVKAGAGVGHDITHARNGEIQIAVFKSDKAAAVTINTGNMGYLTAGNAGDEKILMTGSRRLADDVLYVKAAACAFRVLTDKVEYLQRFSCLNQLPVKAGRGSLDNAFSLRILI